MQTTEKRSVADALQEKAIKIRCGRFTFSVKPLTLMQIYEMSVVANEIQKPDWKDGQSVNVLAETIRHGKDARRMCEIFTICAFRKSWQRRIWRRYIRKHLDVVAFNQMIVLVSKSLNANFFLTSITFLTQAKLMTEPSTTPLGQSSEE